MTSTHTVFLVLLGAFVMLMALMDSLVKIKNKTNLHKHFVTLVSLFSIHILGLLLQILMSGTGIKPIYFEYITYIGAMYFGVEIFLISVLYKDKNKDITKLKWLYIIPTILLGILWTNDWHSLFYVKYSTEFADTVFGPALYVFMVYSYGLIITSFISMVRVSIKQSGFFSPQSALIILGALVPLVSNAMGALRIVESNVYVMPITFSVTAMLYYIAIFHLKALNMIPVSFKTIVDSMSDSFVVVSDDGTIVDLNKTFIDNFKKFGEVHDKDNLYEWMKQKGFVDLKSVKKDIAEARKTRDVITKEYHIKQDEYDKYFEVEYQPIKAKHSNEFVATLILLRDVTTLKKDTEIMLKNESLVMLGELAGGVAHDINTPISAIKSGLLMLKETVKSEDEKMLVERMDSCATKIVTLTNSLRNQIRNIGSDEVMDVNITTVVNDMATIIHNDLTKHRVKLNLDIKEDIIVKGNPAKLSQVVTNIVVNAIQAYEDKGGEIDLKVYKNAKEVVISVEDFAGGIPEHIRESIGKSILTTKGVSGTGFGLYLAYSVIKGAFGGEIRFDTEVGKGTIFYITIPRGK